MSTKLSLETGEEFSGAQLSPPEVVPRWMSYPITPEFTLGFQVRVTSCVPVPQTVMDCGLPPALSVMTSDAPRLPAAVGVNDAVMAQELPAATEEPQVLFSVESAGWPR